MKKFLVIILSLVLALSLAGCTETTPSGGTSSGSSSGDSGSSSGSTAEDGGGMTEDSYTVTLQFPSTVAVLPSLEGIYAIWSNDNSVYTAEFNSSGVAYCNDLDGEYTVTLSETPEGYTYNPNIYEADGGESGRNVTVYMYEISEFTGGNGSSLNQGYRAVAAAGSSSDTNVFFRVYRITFYSSAEFYFEFTPVEAGTYSIETYVSVYENNVNPTLTKYAPSSYTKMVLNTTDGECGTYTKNVRAEISLSSDELGNRGFYGVTIECKNSTYPQYVDIAITWEDYYTDEEMYAQYGGAYTNVYFNGDTGEYPTETVLSYYSTNDSYFSQDHADLYDSDFINSISTDYTTPSGSYTMLRSSSLMNGNFSSTVSVNGTSYTCVYQWTDGFYYYCRDPESYYAAIGAAKVDESDADTFNSYWTPLFVKISEDYLFDGIEGLLGTKPNGWQYQYKVSVTVNGVTQNLNYFYMLIAYQDASNKNSCYPVNDDLKEVLQNICTTSRNTYFYDGNGLLETSYGYSANDEDQWLFGCGVYI